MTENDIDGESIVMGMYDAELSLAVGRQRDAELRAEAERHRLARNLRRAGPPRSSWWRRSRATRSD